MALKTKSKKNTAATPDTPKEGQPVLEFSINLMGEQSSEKSEPSLMAVMDV